MAMWRFRRRAPAAFRVYGFRGSCLGFRVLGFRGSCLIQKASIRQGFCCRAQGVFGLISLQHFRSNYFWEVMAPGFIASLQEMQESLVSCLVAAFLPQLRDGLDKSIRALITPEPNSRRLIVQTYIFPKLLLFFLHAKPWISRPNSSCQETLASA